jgi:hypothetical protein
VNFIDPYGLSKSEEIVKGAYRFIKYAGDLMHGGEHWHVFARRTGELLGRVSLSGEVITGAVPKSALKTLTKLGKIGGLAVGIGLELAFPDDAGASEDMLPPDFGKDTSACH